MMKKVLWIMVLAVLMLCAPMLAEADYTVEFTRNELQYVMPGDTSVALSEILEALDLAGEVTEVTVSNDQLFSATCEDNVWIVTAHQAFSTTEWMHVTINDIVYEITVTDDYDYFIISWDGLQNAFNNASKDESTPTYIMLVGSITAGDSDTALVVPSDKYVTLDLNGYTIDRNHNVFYNDVGCVISVQGNLTVMDTSQIGSITGGYSTSYGGGVYVANGGSFTMNGGNISGNIGCNNGGGVYVGEGGTFAMNGGNISGNNASQNGGGVYVASGSTFTMTGGTISSNNAGDSNIPNANGGGVYVGNGSFTMTGGTISGNNANTNGGGVYVVEDSSFNLSGAPEITGNMKSGTFINGVLSDGTSENVYMESGTTITVTGLLSNTASIGVTMDAPGVFASGSNYTLTAADLTHFTSDNNAYSVRLNGTSAELYSPTFYTITGTGDFTSGTVKALLNGTEITQAAENDTVTLTVTPKTGYILDTLSYSYTQAGATTATTVSLTSAWDETNHVYTASFNMPASEVTVEANFISEWAWLQNQLDVGGTVTLDRDITATAEDGPLVVPSGKSVTLDLNGCTINRGLTEGDAIDNGNVITVNGNLTVRDSSANEDNPFGSGMITGGNNTTFGGGVFVNSTFTMTGGSISGNNAYRGGGVFVNSTFTMTGGTISGNSANDCGGGMFVRSGTFTMTGGSITGNNANEHGGGVHVFMFGAVDLSGAPEITGNVKAEKISNGVFTGNTSENVYLASGRTITVTGSLSNTASIGVIMAEPGVFASESNYTLTADDLTHFTSDSDEYCVRMNDQHKGELRKAYTINGIGDLTNGSIKALLNSNEITQAAENDTVTLVISPANLYRLVADSLSVSYTDESGGTQTANLTKETDENTWTFTMPAANVVVTATFTLDLTKWAGLQAAFNEASVDENNPTLITLPGDVTAGDSDTALAVPSGKYVTLDLNGFTIYRGLTEGDAKDDGNVITVNGNLIVKDDSNNSNGRITGGNNTNFGGGVLVATGGNFAMESGYISGNNASFGGGVYVYYGGNFTMSGGNISDNTAKSYGGGVSVYDTGRFTMTNGHISGNNASTGGGGVLVDAGNFTMNGGSISGNNTNENGGGVYVYYGSFTMEGGNISGNNANSYGGGVYMHIGTFNLSGTPEIKGNVKGGTISNGDLTGGTSENVYLVSGTIITVNDALTNTAYIGVTLPKPDAFASGSNYTLTADDLTHFTSDDVAYRVQLNGTSAKLYQPTFYTISTPNASTTGGTVTASVNGQTVTQAAGNDTVTLTVTPKTGYILDTLSYSYTQAGASEPTTDDLTWNETDRVYTASFTMPPANVTVTAVLVQTEPRIAQNVLQLDGILNLNYYLTVPDGFDGTEASMHFSLSNRTIPFSSAEIDGDYYVFPCRVYAYQMAEPITATFTWQDNGETKTLTDTYSVKEYLDALAEKSSNDVKTLALVNALRNYGHYIQPYLKRINGLTYTEMPEAESVDVNIEAAKSGSNAQISRVAHNTTLIDSLITNVQIRLNINSGTDLMFEFKLADGASGTVTAHVDNDGFSTITPNSKGVYRISKQSIAPNNLEIPHTFEVKVGDDTAFSTTASVMDYINIVLNKSEAEDEKLALAALYEYWAAAENY